MVKLECQFATALDGHKTENKTVLNMVSRIQNRNTGYSDSLFSHNTRVEGNAISSIEGATALKLEESYEVNEEENVTINNAENNLENQQIESTISDYKSINDISSGVSMESASYMENSINSTPSSTEEIIEEYTPKLFSEEPSFQAEGTNEETANKTEQLLDQDINEEEDFEIPAFLRKQKF